MVLRTTTTTRPPRLRLPCRCLFFSRWFFLCFLLIAFFASSGSGRVVTSLPGFDGRLPFHLETGYVEVDEANGAELFYYFVQAESEAAASNAPFILWLTGGHRCSVLSGLAYEIGPIRFVLEPYDGTLPRLRYNPNSWTKVGHHPLSLYLFFSPVPVFSTVITYQLLETVILPTRMPSQQSGLLSKRP
ncbi:hypothetical protein BAE44_0009479 [Dichanthelium oligosanthes]|uniref:Serine carboxypeptidase-like 19 n=1 Tax=Dichanthelium oligosanthes TaxID=888268 RepID=A0A1E5VWL2_9POAL|nr:hypothetical protein BAE44_0009479 [Dichanthelium oligosanthes]